MNGKHLLTLSTIALLIDASLVAVYFFFPREPRLNVELSEVDSGGFFGMTFAHYHFKLTNVSEELITGINFTSSPPGPVTEHNIDLLPGESKTTTVKINNARVERLVVWNIEGDRIFLDEEQVRAMVDQVTQRQYNY